MLREPLARRATGELPVQQNKNALTAKAHRERALGVIAKVLTDLILPQ